MSEIPTRIAESPRYCRGAGVAIYSDVDGITADAVYDGNFDGGDTMITWSDLLTHAPTDTLWKELDSRSAIHHKHGATNE